jgi:hypothetical protein
MTPLACNECGEIFNSKMKIIIDINVHAGNQLGNIKCSYENCEISFKTLKAFSKHFSLDHSMNIQIVSFNFNTMEGNKKKKINNKNNVSKRINKNVFIKMLFRIFFKWKTDTENQKKCLYIRRTSKKQNNIVEYLYYVCHRSDVLRSSNTVNKLIT